jgi:hypothetical protein
VVGIFLLPGWITSQFWDTEASQRSDPAAFFAWIRCWVAAVNWLPWLFSMAWIARIAVRMPGGWKLFWITAVVLTVCSTSIWITVQPPLHGPNSGVLMIYGSGILGLVSNAVEHLMGYGWQFRSWSDWARYTAPSWIQTAIMLFGILMFHFKVTARSEGAGTIQHS